MRLGINGHGVGAQQASVAAVADPCKAGGQKMASPITGLAEHPTGRLRRHHRAGTGGSPGARHTELGTAIVPTVPAAPEGAG